LQCVIGQRAGGNGSRISTGATLLVILGEWISRATGGGQQCVIGQRAVGNGYRITVEASILGIPGVWGRREGAVVRLRRAVDE
jgi:hypothetical protein